MSEKFASYVPHMELNLISLIAAMACFGAGAYSLYRSRVRPERAAMARILFLAGTWTSFSFSIGVTTDPSIRTYVARAIYAVAAFVPDAFCRLVWILLPPRRSFRWYAGLVRVVTLGVVFLAFHPALILGVQDVGPLLAVIPGPLYGFFVGFIMVGMAMGFYELLMRHKELEGIERNKLAYFTVGFILAYVGAAIHFLSAYTGKEPMSHDYLILLYAVLIFLGLWNPSRDFSELIRRLMVQGVFGILMGIPSGFLAWGLGADKATVVWIFGAVALAPAVFSKTRLRIVHWVDKMPFLRGKFVRPETLAREVTLVAETRSLAEWARRVVGAVQDLFGTRSASVFLRQNEMDSFLIKAGVGLSPGELGLLSLPFDSPVIAALERDKKCILSDPLEAASSPTRSEELSDLRFIHACAIAPLFHQRKLFALLCAGPKRSGEIFNSSDLAALTDLASTAQFSLSAVMAGQVRCHDRALVAHDLLRPFGPKGSLTSIRRALQGDFGPVPPALIDPLQSAAQELDFVSGQIKQILNSERPDARQQRAVAVSVLFQKTKDRFLRQAKEKEIRWEVDIPTDDKTIYCDPDLLEHRVLANLVENAFRHTPPTGTVRLGYSWDTLTFTGHVTNDGPGIKPEDLGRLFEPGTQLDPTNKGLAGLGLASVKCVVESHGGTVWAESTPGQKTTFSFSIPHGPETFS